MEDPSTIRAEFDRIALASGTEWNHNSQYHEFLLRNLPARCESALDIGCGLGDFSPRLAARSERVLGLDLSPEMIRLARERSSAFPSIEYQVGDVMNWPMGTERFDCIATIATLHHLPMDAALARIAEALRPGGTLVILDLCRSPGPRGILISGIGVPVNLALRLGHNRRLREPEAVRAAWDGHWRHDHLLSTADVREHCARRLPGARVTRHLLWRYSVVWRKPAGPQTQSPSVG